MWRVRFRRDGARFILIPVSRHLYLLRPGASARCQLYLNWTSNNDNHLTTAAMAQEEKKKKLNIDLPEELASGTYSNLAVITHSQSNSWWTLLR